MDFVAAAQHGEDRPYPGLFVQQPRLPIAAFWTFVEGGGVFLGDASGNGRHATLTATNWGSLERGPVGIFNGSTSIANAPTIPTTSQMWWLFKIFPTSTTGTHGILDKYVTSGTGRSWRIYTSAAAMVLQGSADGTGNEVQQFLSVVTINAWQTFLLAFNNGDFRAWKMDAVGNITIPSPLTFTITSLFENSTVVKVGGDNGKFDGLIEFAAFGYGVVSNELAADMLQRPFADFVVPDLLVAAASGGVIAPHRGEMSAGFSSMPGGFG